MMHYTQVDHVMRYHMGAEAYAQLIHTWGVHAFNIRPMRRENQCEGPYMRCGHYHHYYVIETLACA